MSGCDNGDDNGINEANAEIVGQLLSASKGVFGASCGFADDDIAILASCALWAIKNGIPDDMNSVIIPRAKAFHAGDPNWWHKGRHDKTKGVSAILRKLPTSSR